MWQYVENESKCFSGCMHWNCKTHCHGILQAKGINRTKMGRNGHQIQLFLSQKSLKAQISRRWEDINEECCYRTSPSLCCFHLLPSLPGAGGLRVFVLQTSTLVCVKPQVAGHPRCLSPGKAGRWTVGVSEQCPLGVLNVFIWCFLSSFSVPLHLRWPLTQVTGPGVEFKKITLVTVYRHVFINTSVYIYVYKHL